MPRRVPDLRMPALGLAGWAGGLLGLLGGAAVSVAAVAVSVLSLLVLRRRLGAAALRTGIGLVLVLGAVATAAVVRETQSSSGPTARFASERAVATVLVTVTSDPRPLAAAFGEQQTLLRATVREVAARGTAYRTSARVLVVGGAGWQDVALGSTLRAVVRLGPADGHGLAAVAYARGDPTPVSEPSIWWRGADAVRGSLRASVADRPPSQAALVPALVAGDDGRLDPALAADFRTTGLTHLLAVSGTNLTLVVGFLLVVARWCGVRGRWLHLVGAVGIVGFVLLARTEPSVVRAAAMGTVALLSLGTDGRRRGPRALGVAVVALLLLDPLLALTPGFALSVVATAGIVLLAPGWRDALAGWLPRWAAEAIAVPATAQLACTPIVAALSGQVSLVAVVANLAVAPVVGPATVLGLAGGLVGLAWPAAAGVLGTLAGWCVAWLVLVARHGAGLPTAAVDWSTGAVSLALLTVLVAALALAGPLVLRRPVGGLGCACLLAVVVLVRPPTPGWPAPGWVLAACDVGQGDALVVRTGPGSGLVVDAGPDPAAVDRCLDRLEVERVPLLLLTHFHADHVDGVPGVLRGRDVGGIEVTTVPDPPAGVAGVDDAAAEAGLAPRAAPYAVTRTIGEATFQVLWPAPGPAVTPPGDGSAANDASVVVLVEVGGLRMLLAGDLEPEGQAAVARLWPGLVVDVLKVPHHGSRFQDLAWLTGLGARVAVVSAGEDNDYGHPAPATLDALATSGAEVLRTDLDGDVLVGVVDGQVVTTTE